jgi:hypothetical protein
MRRVFWLAVGLGAGATVAFMATRWARHQAERVAPANVARQAGGALKDLGALLGEAAREFRVGAAEKEELIRSSLPK